MRKWLAGLVLTFSIVLFSISIYFLMGMYMEEKKDAQAYEKVMEVYQNAEKHKLPEKVDEETQCSSGAAEVIVDAGLLALHEENPDCIAWITIDGTAIDYPVMYRPQEKDYYLKRDFYEEWSASGSLFLAEHCLPESSDNLVIYGHHMNSGKMFAALDDYKAEEFYREHRRILLKTLHGNEEYEILAAFRTAVYSSDSFAYYAFTKASGKEDYNAFVNECKKRSLYETGCNAEYGDKLLTLSTCEYSQKNGRMVVVAKKIMKNSRKGADSRNGR